jgi:hypothetical protein
MWMDGWYLKCTYMPVEATYKEPCWCYVQQRKHTQVITQVKFVAVAVAALCGDADDRLAWCVK